MTFTSFSYFLFQPLVYLVIYFTKLLDADQEDFLLEVTNYNIQGRYPDFKRALQNKATPEYTRERIHQIKEFRLWLDSLITR